MKQRMLSLLLVIAMLLQFMPAVYAAETDTPVYQAAHVDTLTLDGDPAETAWIIAYPLEAASDASVSGSASFLWNKDGLALAVRYTGADKLTAYIGGKTLEVDLAAGTASGTGTAAVSADGACAEAILTWEELGIDLLDYGQIISGVTVKLSKGSAEAVLAGDVQIQSAFAGMVPFSSSFGSDYAKNWKSFGANCTVTLEDAATATVSYTINSLSSIATSDKIVRILRANLSCVDHSKDMILSQDLYFDSLPISDGVDSGNTVFSVKDSFFFFLSNEAGGPVLGISVYKAEDGKLYLWSKNNNSAVCLDREEKQNFRLSVQWKTDESCTVYVDGEEKGTFESATYTGKSALGNHAMSIGYNRATANTSAQFTVSNITVQAPGATTTLDGSVTTADIVGSDLYLVEDLPSAWEFSDLIGSVPLTWSSEPVGCVTADGRLVKTVVDQAVTLTASVGSVSLGTVEATIALDSAAPSVEAMPAGEILPDGDLKDQGWGEFYQLTAETSGMPSGVASIAYNKNGIYIGVRYENADTLSVTLAGKTVGVNLADGTVTGVGTAAVTANAAELNMTWEQLGVQPTDYGYRINGFSLTLNGESGTTAMTDIPMDLVLNAREKQSQTLSGFRNSDKTTVVATADSVTFNANAANVYYILKSDIPAVDHSKDVLLQQDVRIDTMPVVTQAEAAAIVDYSSAKTVDCYFFWLSDGVAQQTGSARGPMALAAIYRCNEDGDLMLRVGTGDGADFSTGKKLRETFRLQFLWGADGSVKVFVDGYLIGSLENATAANVAGGGIDTLQLRYSNVTAAGKVTVSNVSLTTAMVDSVLGEITAAAVLAGIDTTCVQVDMKLPDSYVNQYLGTIPLTWKSSDTSILGDDGTIYDYSGATVQLTCSVGETALWTVDITIVPLPEEPAGPAASSPETITAAFSAAEISLDGKLDEEGWIMNGNVLDADSLKVGEFGAQWQDGKLYMAIETRAAETLTLTLNGKTVTIDPVGLTVSGDFAPTLAKAEDDTVVELCVSFAELGLTVEDYNVAVPVTVALDESSYRGSLRLMSVDWFAAENKAHPLPALKGSSKYGLDEATGNQGFAQVNDGWRLFDLYDPEGTNPTQVRSYVILTKYDIYNGWLTHDQTFHAEFDFLAKSLPVYDSSVIGWHESQACYGVPFFISDVSDSGSRSNSVSMGIFNTVDGLAFVLLTNGGGSETVLLEKELGEQFRVGLSWRLGGTLILYIDGEEFAAFENAEENRYSFGNKGIGFNVIRSTQAAQSSADDMDVYITNIALGKSYDDSLLDNLTFEDFKGDNLTPDQVISKLTLPDTLSTPQLTKEQPLTWTTSDAQTIDAEGNVYRPATGGAMVTLTATLPNGDSKDFRLVVLGESNHSGNVLVAYNDLNPGIGIGAPIEVYPFTLDTTNNSVIIDLEESQRVNVAKLTDGDAFARLNEENLTLWASDDNVTYTEIKHFRLLHKGNNWYLYDFDVNARYIKVHCTHFDGTQADFIGEAATMLTACYEEVFGAQGGTFTESSYTLTNSTAVDWKDKAITVSKTDLDITGSGIRVYMDGSLLYHYVDGENVTFRVDDLAAGETATLRILSGNAAALDIANKEYVYEVTYGAKEASLTHARWLLRLDDGTVLAMKSADGRMYSTFSYDGGKTWSERTSVAATENWITRDGGGFLYNPAEPDRIIFLGFYNNGWVAGDITQSDAGINFIISEDRGQTWRQLGSVPKSEDDVHTNYMITYSNGTLLSGNDGAGANIDYVLPIAAQYNNNGSLCGRIAYSADNGVTWTLSESLILLGAADNHEGGCSEMTIEQREDGVLVLLSRCENTESRNFAQAYSYDLGVTWEGIKYSDNYTVNTQPMFYRYDGAPLLVWGGNNSLGGEARVRAPMSIAISHDGMETYSNILDLYSKYTFQGMTKVSMNRITNQSVTEGGEDTLLISWANKYNRIDTTPTMRIYDFTDYFYRTKGAYDSFEHGSVRYEGWEGTAGSVKLSNAQASDGSYSMQMGTLSEATRSIPYLQEGRIALDVYVTDAATFEVELQSAYTNVYGYCAPVGLRVENNVVTFLGADSASGLTLKQDWNTIVFDLKLNGDAPFATVSVNGESEAMPMDLEIGNYVCYITLTADSIIYVDNVLAEDAENALVYMESPASVAMSKITAIGEVTLADAEAIEAARAAYDALAVDQKDLVTNLAVLEAAEAALEELKNAEPEISFNSVSLKGNIGVNYYMTLPESVLADENAYMEFTVAGKTPVKVPVADAIEETVDGVTYYVFTCQVAAKEMTDIITARFVYGENEGIEASEFSVRAYADTIREDTTGKYDAVKPLVEAMLHYGAYAQQHFGYNTGNLANEGLDAAEIDGVSAETLAAYAGSGAGTDTAVYCGNSLLLKSETSLRFFFQVADSETLAVTCGEETLPATERNGMHYVAVENISAKDLDTAYTLNANGAEITASALTYAYNVLSAADGTYDDNLENLVKALYLYNQAANDYFDNN